MCVGLLLNSVFWSVDLCVCFHILIQPWTDEFEYSSKSGNVVPLVFFLLKIALTLGGVCTKIYRIFSISVECTIGMICV